MESIISLRNFGSFNGKWYLEHFRAFKWQSPMSSFLSLKAFAILMPLSDDLFSNTNYVPYLMIIVHAASSSTASSLSPLDWHTDPFFVYLCGLISIYLFSLLSWAHGLCCKSILQLSNRDVHFFLYTLHACNCFLFSARKFCFYLLWFSLIVFWLLMTTVDRNQFSPYAFQESELGCPFPPTAATGPLLVDYQSCCFIVLLDSPFTETRQCKINTLTGLLIPPCRGV